MSGRGADRDAVDAVVLALLGDGLAVVQLTKTAVMPVPEHVERAGEGRDWLVYDLDPAAEPVRAGEAA